MIQNIVKKKIHSFLSLQNGRTKGCERKERGIQKMGEGRRREDRPAFKKDLVD